MEMVGGMQTRCTMTRPGDWGASLYAEPKSATQDLFLTMGELVVTVPQCRQDKDILQGTPTELSFDGQRYAVIYVLNSARDLTPKN